MEKGSLPALKTLWEHAVKPLSRKLTADEFETWIRPMSPVSVAEGVVEVAVPDGMFAAWIERNFLDALADEWVRTTGKRVTFRFVWGELGTQGELFPGDVPEQPQANNALAYRHDPEIAAQRKNKNGLISSYDFNSFVVGPSNQFARAAAVAVAGKPGALYNPFFLFGGVGLGKTHLVNAIGNAILDADPTRNVLLLSAEAFTNRLIDAIARNKAQEFKNRMRRVDVLILDDVQFLAGRERTQEEFFHIFNALYDNGRQIVLTSDKFPNEIHGLEERLCSRFGWGLVADIQPPDEETRVAILERKARAEHIELPMDVARFIAERFEANIRDLEGALTRIAAWSSVQRQAITLSLAKKLLGDGSAGVVRPLTLEEIAERVSRHFGLEPNDLQARRRTRKVAEARQVCMYLMRHTAGASLPTIGEFLGGRDHSTVVHGCQAVAHRMEQDPRFRTMVEALQRSLPAQRAAGNSRG